jgi:hypothetical protein
MAAAYARPRIHAELGSRKHPLPTPFSIRIRILPLKRMRQIYAAKPVLKILLMELTNPFQMSD